MKKSHLRCVWCVFRALVAPTLIIYSLTACAGGVGSLLGNVLTGNFGGGEDIGEASSGESSSGSNATDGSSESSGSSSEDSVTGESGSDSESSSDSGDADAMPTAQGALPSLKADDTFAFAQDSNEDVPITGSVSDYGSDSIVAVSTSDVTATAMLLKSPRPAWARGLFIADAYASTDNVLCSTDGVTCCPLNDDGTFECYYETTDSSVTSVYLAVIDGNGDIVSDSVQEDVHGNVLYLANEPQDMVSVGDDVYALTSGMAVKISPDESGDALAVTGDNSNDYESFSAEGERLAYDETNEVLAVMDSESGVSLMENAGGAVSETGTTLTVEGALSYTKVKAINDLAFFGVETEATTEAELHAAKASNDDETFGSEVTSSNIQFLADGDVDSSGAALSHTKTLAFDTKEIDGVRWTIIAYLDGDGALRVRWVKRDGSTIDGSETEQMRFGGQSSLGAFTQVPELVFYHGNGSEARFATLDTENDKVMLGSVSDLTQDDLSFDTVGVSVSDEPVAMIHKGGRLFVLNKGGQSVSVIRLFNADGTTPRTTPRVSATLNVSDFLEGSNFTFSPRTLMVDDNHVIVGDATTKALIVIDRDSITEESIDDESSTSGEATDTATDTESETTTDTETVTETSTESSTDTSSETSTETTTSSSSSTSTETSTSSSSGSSSSTETSTSSSSSSSETSTSTSTSRRHSR